MGACVVRFRSSFVSAGWTTVASVADIDDVVTTVIYRRVEITASHSGRATTVISVAGDLDRDTAPYLERALEDALTSRGPVCCDLGDVGYFGAAGAVLVIAAAQVAGGNGTAFMLRGVGADAARVLEGLGFDRTLIIE